MEEKGKPAPVVVPLPTPDNSKDHIHVGISCSPDKMFEMRRLQTKLKNLGNLSEKKNRFYESYFQDIIVKLSTTKMDMSLI